MFVALFVAGCRKDSIAPILENNTVIISLSGHAGWKGLKPASNQQGTVNGGQKGNSAFSPSKGGKLANGEVYETMNRSIINRTAFVDQNGRKTYLQKLPSGKLNAVIMSRDGQFVETMKNWSSQEINEKARDEHWPASARDWLDRDNL